MINVMVLYPNKPDAKFDMNYYLNKHIPMVGKLLGSALKKTIVEQGVGGAEPGTSAAFTVICHLHFESVEAFGAAFGPHAAAIGGDIANYTSVEPVIQINDIKFVS